MQRMLQELDLGHTRRKALEGLAERVPTEPVRDFVASVVQAEDKGTPLAEVLSVQARMLRMRRSVRAEESAAKGRRDDDGAADVHVLVRHLAALGTFRHQVDDDGAGLSDGGIHRCDSSRRDLRALSD